MKVFVLVINIRILLCLSINDLTCWILANGYGWSDVLTIPLIAWMWNFSICVLHDLFSEPGGVTPNFVLEGMPLVDSKLNYGPHCHSKDTLKINSEQECIPVGCIPSAAVAGGGGVCLGVSARGCVWPGGCLSRGVSAWGCLPRVCASAQGVLADTPSPLCWGVCPEGCLPDTPLPSVNRMTDRRLWKYYLATTSLRTVKTKTTYATNRMVFQTIQI